jgi:hypothetical protein
MLTIEIITTSNEVVEIITDRKGIATITWVILNSRSIKAFKVFERGLLCAPSDFGFDTACSAKWWTTDYTKQMWKD